MRHVNCRMWKIHLMKIEGPEISRKFLGGGVGSSGWAYHNIPLKAKNKVLYITPPTTKEALVGLFRFWMYHITYLVTVLRPSVYCYVQNVT